ncbi:unnamed protein product, partial [Sphacelaria rigidula]
LDAETFASHPLDEVMDKKAEASLLYTTDPAMASKTQKAMPVQGGFLLVEPNMVVFDRLCDVVRKGNWRKMTGWEGSNIGWFYGGATIQGLLPYFYHILAPGMALEINRCIYNHMCDSVECRAPRYAVITELQQPQQVLVGTIVNTVGASGDGGKGENTRIRGDVQGALDTHSHEDAIADGDVVEISPIKSVHFTQQCPKPWGCRGGAGIHPVSACADLQKMWFDGRKAAFDARGVSFTGACKNGQYSPLPRDTGDIIA